MILLFALAMPPSALAADAPADPSTTAVPEKKKFRIVLWDRDKRRAKRAERLRLRAERLAGERVAAADAEAIANPEGGIWDWVDQMGGEVPTAAQVEALRESQEEHLLEQGLIDELAGHGPPMEFYRDPAGSLAADPLLLDRVDMADFDIPIDLNPWTEKWVTYFTQGSGSKYFGKWLSRGSRYQPMMIRELKAAGLPEDLVYLSMIESGYNAHAYSHAAAAGLWQFIEGTGLEYDLRIDWWVDERRDPEASLKAAIRYLSWLHRKFGDWRLAWASYNGGPGRVGGALKKAETQDFWVLANGPYLHPETDNYVPKIMAAAIVGKHPERYGFTFTPEPELVYDVAPVEGSVDFGVLARCAGTTVDELKALNPALRRFATPPEGYALRVPSGRQLSFLAALAAVPEADRLEVVRHTIQRGDTLSGIAQRYGSTVEDIRQANGLQSVNRIAVGLMLVIPGGTAVASAAPAPRPAARPAPSTPAPAPDTPAVHVVRGGDTLSGIAGQYRVPQRDLESWNGIADQGHIVVGQEIRLRPPEGATSPAAVTTTHTIASGETLSGIAAQHGVRTRELQDWNDISDPSHIVVGKTLEIRGAPAPDPWVEYTVVRGDSLGRIAVVHGCTIADLQEWNTIEGSTIYPGQKIKIKRS